MCVRTGRLGGGSGDLSTVGGNDVWRVEWAEGTTRSGIIS